jgi:predicted dehydrogenase
VNLTPEQAAIGRRNFLKAVAGLPAVAGLGAAAALRGPVPGGPVRLGFVGLGGQGRLLLEQADPAFAEVRALCDVNPTQLERARAVLTETNRPPAREYADWQTMLEREDVEGVVVATPLWTHADITTGCFEAGRHVLCEKMMAWDVASCERMLEGSRRSGRVLEIGYQRFYNTVYQAAYAGIVRAGVLGDVYHARLAWHRNGNWRRSGEPPTPDYSPAKWGYPTFEHLLNWRLYKKYSRGLLAELGSHQVAIANWFFGGPPDAVLGTGGIHRFNDGREVDDHIYATFEYPGSRTAVFSTIESNAFDDYYEAFFGTKGTLVLKGERDAFLFEEGSDAAPTSIAVTSKAAGPALAASESRVADAAGSARTGTREGTERLAAYRDEVSGLCAAIRMRRPLACGPERALHSARACLRAFEAVEQKTRLTLGPVRTS